MLAGYEYRGTCYALSRSNPRARIETVSGPGTLEDGRRADDGGATIVLADALDRGRRRLRRRPRAHESRGCSAHRGAAEAHRSCIAEVARAQRLVRETFRVGI